MLAEVMGVKEEYCFGMEAAAFIVRSNGSKFLAAFSA